MFGGGVSDTQLAWLDTQLAEAAAAQQAVVVVTHVPLHPDTAPTPCVLWNYQEVRVAWREGRGVRVQRRR
jgi:manganese-dependent ADP-ribose/CDP-alcohol diphosphatase